MLKNIFAAQWILLVLTLVHTGTMTNSQGEPNILLQSKGNKVFDNDNDIISEEMCHLFLEAVRSSIGSPSKRKKYKLELCFCPLL
jgi:hypothetical protein